MTRLDWGIVLVGGIVGWTVVAWSITVIRQQKRPPLNTSDELEQTSAPRSESLGVVELASHWASILGTTKDASAEDIDTAYHARIAECDRIRFTPNVSSEDKQGAEQRRVQIEQAFEFIRPIKQ